MPVWWCVWVLGHTCSSAQQGVVLAGSIQCMMPVSVAGCPSEPLSAAALSLRGRLIIRSTAEGCCRYHELSIDQSRTLLILSLAAHVPAPPVPYMYVRCAHASEGLSYYASFHNEVPVTHACNIAYLCTVQHFVRLPMHSVHACVPYGIQIGIRTPLTWPRQASLA